MLIVHKNVFSRIFPHRYCRPESTFQGLLSPPEGGGELVFDDEAQDPRQGRLLRLMGLPYDIKQILYRRTRCVIESLSLVADQPSVHYGSGVGNRFGAFSLFTRPSFSCLPMLDDKKCTKRSLMGLGKIVHSGLSISVLDPYSIESGSWSSQKFQSGSESKLFLNTESEKIWFSHQRKSIEKLNVIKVAKKSIYIVII